jgi:transposase
MNATTVAVDLAKNVFELAVADGQGRIVERARLTRGQFARWFANREVSLVVMEACGSAHHWGRWLGSQGISVKLLPAKYVRAFVKRNKTDSGDATALLEAARSVRRAAAVAREAGRPLDRLRTWAVAVQARTNHNKAACALANKLARICYATWCHGREFTPQALPA